MTPRKNLEEAVRADTRKVHMHDVDHTSMVECGLFWKSISGEEKLRTTDDWYKVTCLRCLTYWKKDDIRTSADLAADPTYS